MKKFILYSLLLFTSNIFAQIASIPMKTHMSVPSNDLVYNGNILGVEEANALSKTIDLSKLNPLQRENGIWYNFYPSKLEDSLDDIDIKSSDRVFLYQVLKSDDEVFRFNVTNEDNSKMYTLYADKTLHTTLLRKNLLRKIGYKIPAIKYLKSISINFENLEQKKSFMKSLRLGTSGREEKWIKNDNDLEVELRDIAAIELNDQQLYNVAMGVPGGALSSRLLRSLVLPYSILNLNESVNKFPWYVGRITQSKRLELPHFFSNNNFYTTSFADIKWIANRIAKLNILDFREIVEKAYFPAPVADLVLEKIISRTQYLLNKLDIKHYPITYNENISNPPYLINGKLVKEQWFDQGYASEFAYGDAESPFKEFKYYIYSMLQSVAIDSLVGKLNDALKAFNPNDARMDLAEKQFKEGLEHFIETGEFLQFPVSTWYSPIANGKLIVSRDVVFGNYLGTENMVQLADTFGFGATLGAMMGVENVDYIDNVGVTATGTYLKTYTHLKPLKSLKSVFDEDYKNLLIPFLKRNLRKYLYSAYIESNTLSKKITEVQELIKTLEDPEAIEKAENDLRELVLAKNEKSSSVLSEINKLLSVGESLIITEKIVPKLGARGKIPLGSSNFSLDLNMSADYIGVKRLQILRKDVNTIQIFDDKGKGFGNSFSIDLENLIPIIRYERRSLVGDFSVKAFKLNISTDQEKNPDFASNIKALNSVLFTGGASELDFESDDSNLVSAQVYANFEDIYKKFSFLFWRKKWNEGFTNYHVNSSTGFSGNYQTYHHYERSGMNWESFVKDIANYYFAKASVDVEWANNIWGNSGQSLYGSAEVLESTYESQIHNDDTKKEYISLVKRYEGWSNNRGDLEEIIDEVNTHFEKNIFSKDQLTKINKLYLYDINAQMRIYNKGISKIKALSKVDLIRLSEELDKTKKRQCRNKKVYKITTKKMDNDIVVDKKTDYAMICGNLNYSIANIDKCKLNSVGKAKSECWLKITKELFKDLPMNKLIDILGTDNYYITGEINGFRKDAEILNDTIFGDEYGRYDPRYVDGIIRKVQRKVDIQNGEFTGQWLRERP